MEGRNIKAAEGKWSLAEEKRRLRGWQGRNRRYYNLSKKLTAGLSEPPDSPTYPRDLRLSSVSVAIIITLEPEWLLHSSEGSALKEERSQKACGGGVSSLIRF